MKNLANCKPSEFLRQTNKIRHYVQKWMDITDDAALEEHPEETMGVLALACFIPAEEAESHPMEDYLISLSELMESEGAIRFFTSLVNLGLKSGT